MANEQYTIDNGDRADGSTFVVPGDEDGGAGDDSFAVDQPPLDQRPHTYVHVENGWDVNVDVTLQGSHHLDDQIDAPVEDGATETIASGANGAFDSETAHSVVELKVTPASDPTSGQLVVTFQARED